MHVNNQNFSKMVVTVIFVDDRQNFKHYITVIYSSFIRIRWSPSTSC